MMRRTSKQRKVKHVPQRTCIACRKIQGKQAMIRVVDVHDGRIEVDIGGKMSGRGAYLCQDIHCWEEGLKGNRLEHAFKRKIDQDSKSRLLEWVKIYLDKV